MAAFVRKRAGLSHRAARQAARLRDIHSSIDGLPSGSHSGHSHNLKGSSAAKLTIDAAKYFECATIEENRDDYIVPRQSLTRKHLLGAFPVQVETEAVRTRQLDHQTGRMIETTDNRVTWRSDSTLLRRNKPFQQIGTFQRDGMVAEGLNTRKYREYRKETPIARYENTPNGIREVDDPADILGPEIDHVDFDD